MLIANAEASSQQSASSSQIANAVPSAHARFIRDTMFSMDRDVLSNHLTAGKHRLIFSS